MNWIIHSLKVSVWFMFLTFPIMVIKVNTVEQTVDWRWNNMIIIGVAAFILALLWKYFDFKKVHVSKSRKREMVSKGFQKYVLENKKVFLPSLVAVCIVSFTLPFFVSIYWINVLTGALVYIVLGLGLNIVVGLAGLLDLGYVAFYAVGAYSYALLNLHFGLDFWLSLPIGAGLGALFGILLGYPVLRLRGDYLAIVTLGFGEIIRLVLENWSEFSKGPSGISGIPKPNFFGMDLDLDQSLIAIYFLVLVMVVFTIFVVNRLQNSRIGRAWIALREDEIACQAMGIDKTKTKLTAFALGATWAGMAGAVFAAKTTFINPASFTFLESAIILAIVVFGGMGSIAGVIMAALILVITPELMREFNEYRMLIFGGSMVIMMVFKPQGLISNVRRKYLFHKDRAAK